MNHVLLEVALLGRECALRLRCKDGISFAAANTENYGGDQSVAW